MDVKIQNGFLPRPPENVGTEYPGRAPCHPRGSWLTLHHVAGASQLEVDGRSALDLSVASMHLAALCVCGVGRVSTMGIDQEDPQVVDGLVLMRAFLKIANAEDRR